MYSYTTDIHTRTDGYIGKQILGNLFIWRDKIGDYMPLILSRGDHNTTFIF